MVTALGLILLDILKVLIEDELAMFKAITPDPVESAVDSFDFNDYVPKNLGAIVQLTSR